MRNTRVEHQVEVATNTLNHSEQSLEESRDLQAFWNKQELKADLSRLGEMLAIRGDLEDEILDALRG